MTNNLVKRVQSYEQSVKLKLWNKYCMLKYYFYPFLWLLFVTGLSVMPGVSLPKFDLFSSDKLAHAFVYCVMCILVLYGWRGITKKDLNWIAVIAIIAGCTAYGILMEFVQYAFVPGRMYESDDMIANAVGALAGGWTSKVRLQKWLSIWQKNG